MSPRTPEPTRAVYVRIPVPVAEKLDRAAEERGTSKRDVIAALLSEHLDTDRAATAQPRRVVIEDSPDRLRVGHHSFIPAPAAEVLTLEDAADLLRVPADTLRELAQAGEVPGRRIGDEWRFSREALLGWLGAAG